MSSSMRLLTFIGPNGDDRLVAQRLLGEEILADEFEFTIHGISTHSDIDGEQWIGQPVSVQLQTLYETRVINAVVKQFVAADYTGQGYRHYSVQLIPWFAALDLSQDCRLFQNLSVPKIVQQVCRELGFTDIDINQLGKSYDPLVSIAQYNETARHFLRRIMSEAGIYYRYVHQNNKCILTLLDIQSSDPSSKPSIRQEHEQITRPQFTRWTEQANSYVNSEQTTIAATKNQQKDSPYYAEGNVLSLQTNAVFTLDSSDIPDDNGDYRVISIRHEAHDYSQYSPSNIETDNIQNYSNTLGCQPKATTFTPLVIAKVRPNGPQPAQVTGAKNKAIYTDASGRVKIHFLWDRKGTQDENSSPWIYVTQPTSGENFGTQFIPRVGDEVIVDFIDNDIDKPVIVGSRYNSTNQPIFDPSKAVSGFKTRLIQTDGSTNEGHELSFDDTEGNEAVCLKSAGDILTQVNQNCNQSIGGDNTITINSDSLVQILNGSANIGANEICLQAGASQVVINAQGIQFKPAGKLLLKANGVGGAFPLARVGDKSSCSRLVNVIPDQGGPLLKGSQIVTSNGQAVSRVGDPLGCVNSNDKIKKGADNILVDGKPVAHAQSQTEHGGVVKQGSSKVVLADRGPIPNEIKPVRADQKVLHVKSINLLSSQPAIQIRDEKHTIPANGDFIHPLNSKEIMQPVGLSFLEDNICRLPHTLNNWQLVNDKEYRLYLKQDKISDKIDVESDEQLVVLHAIDGVPKDLSTGTHTVNELSSTQQTWFSGLLQSTIINGFPVAADIGKKFADSADRAFLLDFIGDRQGKFYVKESDGMHYVIFKGSASLRDTIKGTRYRYDNPKIKAIKTQILLRSGNPELMLDGIKEVAKDSRVGILIVVGIDVLEKKAGLLPQKDWIDVLADIFMDVSKLAISVIAGALIVMLAAVEGTVITILAISFVTAFFVGIFLDAVDENLRVTEKVEEAAHKMLHLAEKEFVLAKEWLQHVSW